MQAKIINTVRGSRIKQDLNSFSSPNNRGMEVHVHLGIDSKYTK